MVIRSTLVNAARNGDLDAIATLLHQVLAPDTPFHITVRQTARSLKVTLEGPIAPAQDQYFQTIYATLICLSIPQVERIQVHGKASNTDIAAWIQRWETDTGYGLIHLSNQLAKRPQRLPWYLALARWSDDCWIMMMDWIAAGQAKIINAQQTITQKIQIIQLPQPAVWVKHIASHPPVRQMARSIDQRPMEASAVALGIFFATGFSAGYLLDDSEHPKQTTIESLSPPDIINPPDPTPAPQSPLPIQSLALSTQKLAAKDMQAAINTAINTATANQPPPIPTPAVVLKAVGDIIPGTNYPSYRLPADANILFQKIAPYLQKENDILFGNYESTLTDYPYSAKNIGNANTFAFRSPPAYAQVLRQAGFDIMSVANNHSFDFGQRGFEDTMAHLNKSGIKTVGQKGEIVYLEVNGITVAFIAFSYFPDHNLMHDLTTSDSLVKQADQQADIVVISVHAGAEGTTAVDTINKTEYFLNENRGNIVQFAHSVIDSGADLVLGHGPHVPRALELYQDRLIAYSLGNFLGYKTLPVAGALGQSMILQVGMDADGRFYGGSVTPVLLDRNGLPYLDNSFKTVGLLRTLMQRNFPNTPLAIDGDGRILVTD